MLLSEFFFYVFSNEEFVKEIGVWVYDLVSLLFEFRDLFKDIILSLEKIDD